MVTRVFWIAVSLLESDYEHEFLMAIHLLNKVSLLERKQFTHYVACGTVRPKLRGEVIMFHN